MWRLRPAGVGQAPGEGGGPPPGSGEGGSHNGVGAMLAERVGLLGPCTRGNAPLEGRGLWLLLQALLALCRPLNVPGSFPRRPQLSACPAWSRNAVPAGLRRLLPPPPWLSSRSWWALPSTSTPRPGSALASCFTVPRGLVTSLLQLLASR